MVHSDLIDVGKVSVRPPKAVERFIERFDEGLYEDLEYRHV